MARLNYNRTHRGEFTYRNSNNSSYVDDNLPATGSYADQCRFLKKPKAKKKRETKPAPEDQIKLVADFFYERLSRGRQITTDEIWSQVKIFEKHHKQKTTDSVEVDFASKLLIVIHKRSDSVFYETVLERLLMWLHSENLKESLLNRLSF